MRLFLRTIFVVLSVFLCLFHTKGQERKLESDTITKSQKRIDLLIREKVLKERGTLEISEEDTRRKLDST